MMYVEPLPFAMVDTNVPYEYDMTPSPWRNTQDYVAGDLVYVVYSRSGFKSHDVYYYVYEAIVDNTNASLWHFDGWRYVPIYGNETWRLVSISKDPPDSPSEYGYYKWTETEFPAGATVAVTAAYGGNEPTYGMYRAVVDTTANDWPPTSPEKWEYIGVVHRYRPFDGAINTVARQSEAITYTLSFAQPVSALAFFGVAADSISVRMTTADGAVVYDQTFELIENFTDWWGYFFDPIERRDSLYVSGLPMYRDATLYISIDAPGDVAEVGAIVPGRAVDTGVTLQRSGVSTLDLSERTDLYGFAALQDHGYLRATTLLAMVDNRSLSATMRRLFGLRNRLIAFVGDERDDGYELFRSYGFLRRASALVERPTHTVIHLEIEESL